jgi:hypothetical protein
MTKTILFSRQNVLVKPLDATNKKSLMATSFLSFHMFFSFFIFFSSSFHLLIFFFFCYNYFSFSFSSIFPFPFFLSFLSSSSFVIFPRISWRVLEPTRFFTETNEMKFQFVRKTTKNIHKSQQTR